MSVLHLLISINRRWSVRFILCFRERETIVIFSLHNEDLRALVLLTVTRCVDLITEHTQPLCSTFLHLLVRVFAWGFIVLLGKVKALVVGF